MCDPGQSEEARGSAQGSPVMKRLGVIATCAVGGSLFALYAVAAPFVAPALRKVIAAAKQGFHSVGFELNPWLVWYSRYRAWREGVHRHTSFHISNLWKVSFAQYSNVVIFGVPQMMEQLEAKLQSELQTSAKVVACRFPFPTWTPDHVAGEGIDTVWVYDAKTFKSQVTTAKLLKNSEDSTTPHQ
ncbi:ATP synthase subunit C lysine N-methyltransferase isoform X2 [Pygocentrus nattereri]|uniref:ATP synthase subunit C lysine N-methyltransferase isoform X2 n=1 Tax=Pygocentrus nattereri TaxID=42514 RepID=UPI000814A4B6|nr:ATP synthase subunit C lysine N-methyltransferase isoform X2 [Pygocentrus nattereri]